MKRLLLLFLCMPMLAVAQNRPIIPITSADIQAQNFWSRDNIYLLDDLVFVETGETLTIEAGTVVKFKEGEGEDVSALVVARGGRLVAEGIPYRPIIFTAESDDVDRTDDIPPATRGLWGGVVVLGSGCLNTTGGQNRVPGIPSSDNRGLYGGGGACNPQDNSGSLRYVSIRYAGAAINTAPPGSGLWMGAVGAQTKLDYIEVFQSAGDGFTWQGGSAKAMHLASIFNADDAFVYGEGFRGRGQFWFGLMPRDQGTDPRAGEHWGGFFPVDGAPYAIPEIYNVTYIGSGQHSGHHKNDAFRFTQNAGGKYYNSIFMEFGNIGLWIEDAETGQDSRARMEANHLVFANNIWYHFAAGNTFDEIAPQDFVQAHLATRNNRIFNPELRGVTWDAIAFLDPRPIPSSAARIGAGVVPPDGFFVQTMHYGAFGDEYWLYPWTAVYQLGFAVPVEEEEIPQQVTLAQNFPNPFNPATTISFTLSQAEFVTLQVFDVLGREVARLVEELKTSGTHHVSFTAEHVPSGMYFYQLRTATSAHLKTMTLVK